MPVSSGLQKYFDSQYKKKSKGDFQKKIEDLSVSIDPAFMQSFEMFHEKIMGIMDENPDAWSMIEEEIEDLDIKLKNTQRVHDMKKAAAIVKTSDA